MIPLDKLTGVCWYNGSLVALEDAKVPLLTHALHYGGAVFEGVRVYNYKPFKLQEHLERLYASADALGYAIPHPIQELHKGVLIVLEKQKIESGYIRPFAWRGSETQAIGGENCSVNVAVVAWKAFDKLQDKLRQEEGLCLEVAKWRKPHANSVPYKAKAAGIYMMSTIIKNTAVSHGFDDALILDQEGFVTEATTSNFFYVKDERLYTAIPDCFLDGITRQTVLAIASAEQIKTQQKKVSLLEVANAESAFLTGTAMGIMPVRSIYSQEEGLPIKLNVKGTLMRAVMERYEKLVSS